MHSKRACYAQAFPPFSVFFPKLSTGRGGLSTVLWQLSTIVGFSIDPLITGHFNR